MNRGRLLNIVGWLLATASSAYACHLAVYHATPIDRALPFVAVVVTLVAWLGHPASQAAVPLLLVTEIAVPQEPTRLLLFGVIVAAAFVWSLATTERNRIPIALLAILVLRWIPFSEVRIGREVFLLLLAAAIVYCLRETAFAVTFGVVIALITPAVPLRTLALPLAVALFLAFGRAMAWPRIVWTIPSLAVLAFFLTFFAWSGIAARAFPYLLKPAVGEPRRHTVNFALGPSQSAEIEVPHEAKALIVSGANVARLRRGAVLGRVTVSRSNGTNGTNGTNGPYGTIRIGDASDWGYLRRDFFYGARNPLPRDPVGKVREYGYVAWIDGAGRVALPPNARTIRVTGDAALPKDASLQVEAFELR